VAKRPYVIVGAFFVGMLLTPPDVFSQTLLAVPMWLLFELGIIFSRLLLRQRAAGESPEAQPAPAAGVGPTGPAGGGSGLIRDPAVGGGKTDSEIVVGREIDAGDLDDPGRWRPLTDEEMEEELDLMDAQEASRNPPPPSAPGVLDPVDEKIQRANRLRELENHFAARKVLYEVLEEGDESQRRVARNILNQLDEA
jgi:sec-independent protein translocase protein TatC